MDKLKISEDINIIKYLKDNTLSLEVKGFIAFLKDLSDRKLDLTTNLLVELSGISKDKAIALMEKCIELGIISYK